MQLTIHRSVISDRKRLFYYFFASVQAFTPLGAVQSFRRSPIVCRQNFTVHALHRLFLSYEYFFMYPAESPKEQKGDVAECDPACMLNSAVQTGADRKLVFCPFHSIQAVSIQTEMHFATSPSVNNFITFLWWPPMRRHHRIRQ